VLANKWRHGKVQFALPPLSQRSITAAGIKPMSFILDKSVGPEIVLLITEPAAQIKEFEGREITSFHLNSGLANTSNGPVYWLFFYFPSPATGQRTTYECVVNPKDDTHLSLFRRLAEQDYWHVLMADDEGAVCNLFEFPNTYGLSETLISVVEICSSRNVSDFMAANAEYQAKFTVDELFAAPPTGL
jgi:hypothetical protein